MRWQNFLYLGLPMLILLQFCIEWTFLFFNNLERFGFVCFVYFTFIKLTGLQKCCTIFLRSCILCKKRLFARFTSFCCFWNSLLLRMLYWYCCKGFYLVNCLGLFMLIHLCLTLCWSFTSCNTFFRWRRLSLLVYSIKPSRTANQTVIIC